MSDLLLSFRGHRPLPFSGETKMPPRIRSRAPQPLSIGLRAVKPPTLRQRDPKRDGAVPSRERRIQSAVRPTPSGRRPQLGCDSLPVMDDGSPTPQTATMARRRRQAGKTIRLTRKIGRSPNGPLPVKNFYKRISKASNTGGRINRNRHPHVLLGSCYWGAGCAFRYSRLQPTSRPRPNSM
jgi:hypothetical protein